MFNNGVLFQLLGASLLNNFGGLDTNTGVRAADDPTNPELDQMLPPELAKPKNTNDLVRSIFSSDTNGDGNTTRQELASTRNKISQQLTLMSLFARLSPALATRLQPTAEKLLGSLNAINYLGTNYNTFQDGGSIGLGSIKAMLTAASIDGNIKDFSGIDLEELKRIKSSYIE